MSFQLTNLSTNQTFAAGSLTGANGAFIFDFDCNGTAGAGSSCAAFADAGTYDLTVSSQYLLDGVSKGGQEISQVTLNYVDPPQNGSPVREPGYGVVLAVVVLSPWRKLLRGGLNRTRRAR